MLEVHPKANSYEYFSSLITSPYVEKREIGDSFRINLLVCVIRSGTTPSNLNDLDKYFKPFDIVKIREVNNQLIGIEYFHYGIYLGDIGDNKRICHFTR